MSQTDSSRSGDNASPEIPYRDGTVHFRHYRKGEGDRRAFNYGQSLQELRETLGPERRVWRFVRRMLRDSAKQELADLEEISASAADGYLTV